MNVNMEAHTVSTNDERKPVTIMIRCKSQGYAFDLTAECLVDHIPGLLHKLQATGIEAGNSPYLWSGEGKGNGNGTASATGGTHADAPYCGIHGVPMKQSKKNPNNYYCSRKIGEDEIGNSVYCDEKVWDWHPN